MEVEPTRPDLPADAVIVDGTDVDGVWDRFEVFEALHHNVAICNPMTSADLDDVVEALAPAPGDAAIDFACGNGELLARLGERTLAAATGVDLSPWMIARAAHEVPPRAPDTAWTWTLGNARDVAAHPQFTIATCLGASWIWHGGAGTVRALARAAAPGGRIAVGEMYLRDGVDPSELAPGRSFLTGDDIEREMRSHNITPTMRIDTGDDAFDSYLERTRAAAVAWRERYPGRRADEHLATHDEWVAARETDAPLLTWSVWIGHKMRPDEP